MERVYELTTPDRNRPVLVAPLGEYLRARWRRNVAEHAPCVAHLRREFAAQAARIDRTGRPPEHHLGFVIDTIRQHGVQDAELPELVPGQCIAIDRDARKVRIFDPLESHADRKTILALWVAVYHKHLVPRQERLFEKLSDADLDVWQRWLDAAVSAGHAEEMKPPASAPEQSEPVSEEQSAVQPQAEPVQSAPQVPTPVRRPVIQRRR